MNWLLFDDTDILSNETLNQVYIPINTRLYIAKKSNASYEISELYQYRQFNKKIKHELGNWTNGIGLALHQGNIYQRRKNFNGEILRYSAREKNPCFIKNPDSYEKIMCLNFNIIMFLSRTNNFTAQLVIGAGTSGKKEMIMNDFATMQAALIDGSADMTVAVFYMVPKPVSPIIDYIHPSMILVENLNVKLIQANEKSWSSYLAPFSPEIWQAISGWIILSGVVMFATQTLISRYESSLKTFSFVDGIMNSFKTHISQAEDPPANIPARIIQTSLFISSMFFFQAYSAVIISFITAQHFRLPFTTLQEFIEVGNYKIATVNGGAQHIYLKYNTIPIITEINEKELLLPDSQMPVSEDECMKRMCSEKLVILAPSSLVLRNQIVKCRADKLPGSLYTSFISIRTQHRLPFLKFLRVNMIRSYETGILYKEIYLDLYDKKETDEDIETFSTVNFDGVKSVVAFYAVFIILSVVILIFEILYYLTKTKNTKKIKLQYIYV